MARLLLVLKSKKAYFICFTCLVIFLFVLFLKYALDSTSEIMPQKPPEHTLCVLVPFRDVFEELLEFIPHMNEFLNRQKINFHFIIINQATDGHRFNRGSVFNAGFELISKKHSECDYVALHDIDLLPLNDEIPYTYPGDDYYHVASCILHPTAAHCNNDQYVGGVGLISNKQYIHVNGFSNNFWGWGAEDRNFYFRLKQYSIPIRRPFNLSTDRNNTFRHIHSTDRLRDYVLCPSLVLSRNNLSRNEFESGLSDLNYKLVSERSFKMNDIRFTMYSIKVSCDYSKTPWCSPEC
ncbi:xylosylprotein 4-beta-galactosyltransferase-like [Planococcus citri]|uniref:xylosylprotein 4-beta-galactosyltransferase-like n=1 Tax=Planococcus citri TaxID=170843 RepID=UPI0031F9A173